MTTLYDKIEEARAEFNVYLTGDLALLDNEDDTIIYNLVTKKWRLGRINVDDQDVGEPGILEYENGETAALSLEQTDHLLSAFAAHHIPPYSLQLPEVAIEKVPWEPSRETSLPHLDGVSRVHLRDAIESTRAIWIAKELDCERESTKEFPKIPSVWRITINGLFRNLFISHEKPQVILHEDHYYIFVGLWDGKVEIYRTFR